MGVPKKSPLRRSTLSAEQDRLPPPHFTVITDPHGDDVVPVAVRYGIGEASVADGPPGNQLSQWDGVSCFHLEGLTAIVVLLDVEVAVLVRVLYCPGSPQGSG